MGLPPQEGKPRSSDDTLEALLPETESLTDDYYEKSPPTGRRNIVPRLSYFANLLLAGTILALLLRQRSDVSLHGADQPGSYSPAEEAVEYVPQQFLSAFGKETSPYQGWPTDEKDQLWEDMYAEGLTIRIREEEHSHLINKTEHVAIPGLEKDYISGLDVFHQLHCLNMIRMSVYPKRYNSSIVSEGGMINYIKWRHLDHCIESLRQSVTCNADMSMIKYEWASFNMLEPNLGVVHMCRNFSKIRDWAAQRFVNTGDRRQHVENGKIVDYATGKSYEEHAAGYTPKGWDKTVNDL